MSSAEDIAATILNLPDGEIDRADKSALADRAFDLLDEDFLGIALKARAAVGANAPVNVLLAVQNDGARAFHVTRDDNCILAGVDRANGKVRFGQIFQDWGIDIRPAVAAPRREPTGASAQMVSGSVTRHDANEILALDGQPARYRLAAICYDWLSNIVEVMVGSGGPRESGSFDPPRPKPAVGVASYLPSTVRAGGARVPDAVLELTAFASPKRLMAAGSFIVETKAFHAPDSQLDVVDTDGVARRVTAVIPATIAIVSAGRPAALCFELAVPAYANTPMGAAIGFFTVDLLHGTSINFAPGNYAAYLFVDDHIYGPVTFEQPSS